MPSVLISSFSFDSSQEKLELLRGHQLSLPLPGVTMLSHTLVYTAHYIDTEMSECRDQTGIWLEKEEHCEGEMLCWPGEREMKKSG